MRFFQVTLKPLIGRLFNFIFNSYQIKMKKKTSKKKLTFTITGIVVIMFLSLAATGNILLPAIITNLSRWTLIVLPFLKQGNPSCSCISKSGASIPG
jgi:hypothetical protein